MHRRRVIFLAALTVAVATLLHSGAATASPPPFPAQFSAVLRTTAHLIDENAEYPPRLREIRILYDRPGQRARADMVRGFEHGRHYIRRYDKRVEYLVETGEFAQCERSHLGVDMPEPEWDAPFVPQEGEVTVHGVACRHWTAQEGDSVLHLYVDKNLLVPVQLVEETVLPDGSHEPLMTYDLTDVQLGPPGADAFELPAPYTHKACSWHVGGFPYIHAFHRFLRF